MANKQPVVIVIDGTYNLVTTNNRNATARYPDAHQGYLNQVIALNEAMGFTDEDYSHVGKSSEDVREKFDCVVPPLVGGQNFQEFEFHSVKCFRRSV